MLERIWSLVSCHISIFIYFCLLVVQIWRLIWGAISIYLCSDNYKSLINAWIFLYILLRYILCFLFIRMVAHAIELLTAGSDHAEMLLHEERQNLGGISIEELHRLVYALVLSSYSLTWQVSVNNCGFLHWYMELQLCIFYTSYGLGLPF